MPSLVIPAIEHHVFEARGFKPSIVAALPDQQVGGVTRFAKSRLRRPESPLGGMTPGPTLFSRKQRSERAASGCLCRRQ
jgi:hypothetical protein